jgi:signal transduction histidine kinase
MRADSLFTHAPIMVAIVRGPDYLFEFANPLYLRTFGLNEDIIGRPFREVFEAFDTQYFDRLVDKVYMTGEPYVDYERHVKVPGPVEHSSASIYVNVAYQPIVEDGKVASLCMYAMDVTSHVVARLKHSKSKQKLLNQKTEQLQHQNQELKELNTSKDEFIALASHQLRTPATGVKQYIGMVLEGYVGKVTSPQRSFLEQAYQSNERQLSTINDMLQIAQIDANKIVLHSEELDIGALVRAVVAEQRTNIKSRGQLVRVRQKSDQLVGWADPLRLRMVLDNLVDNASKYSHAQTTVTITLDSSPTDVIVRVSDQGVGIAKHDYIRLFQKFSRIDNPLSIMVGGNGLGLYLAKRIIDAHGGKIDVWSVLERGTTFSVYLPKERPKL